MISEIDKTFMRLVLRTTDQGEGWRRVSATIWRAFSMHVTHKELYEIDEDSKRIRLSAKGVVVAEYLA